MERIFTIRQDDVANTELHWGDSNLTASKAFYANVIIVGRKWPIVLDEMYTELDLNWSIQKGTIAKAFISKQSPE